MSRTGLFRLIATLVLPLGLAACPAFGPPRDVSREARAEMDAALVHSTSARPLLRFPARIGLVRFAGDGAAPVPPDQAEAWLTFARDNADLGTFVPISPLLVDFSQQGYGSERNSLIDAIRIAAAPQHLDAVLLYTTEASKTDDNSPLSLFDLTIVGAYVVPSRRLKSEATATALLFDVRNGYPYGKLTASASRGAFVPSVGSDDRGTNLSGEAASIAVQKLTGELATLTTKLLAEANEREINELRQQAATRSALPKPSSRNAP